MEQARQPKVDRFTLAALLIGLVLYPLAYSTDFFGRLLFAAFPQLLPFLLDETSRAEWWYFAGSALAFHVTALLPIWYALKRNGETWASCGLDWAWFWRHRVLIAGLLAALIAAAFVMPGVHYGDAVPSRSATVWIGPVTTGERLFMIALFLVVAGSEEIIFRGFALTRLRRWSDHPWLWLIVTSTSFVLIHGEPRNVAQAANYFVAGLAFGAPFILMRLRRLELVIAVHFLINASLVLAP